MTTFSVKSKNYYPKNISRSFYFSPCQLGGGVKFKILMFCINFCIPINVRLSLGLLCVSLVFLTLSFKRPYFPYYFCHLCHNWLYMPVHFWALYSASLMCLFYVKIIFLLLRWHWFVTLYDFLMYSFYFNICRYHIIITTKSLVFIVSSFFNN